MLRDLVDWYLQEYSESDAAEEAWWRTNARTFAEAVEKSALSRLPNSAGKLVMHSHQRRPGQQKLREVAWALEPHLNRIAEARDFEGLFNTTEEILEPMPGVGELIIYDVATRIGHHMGIAPAEVYLHSGTRKGAIALDPRFAKRKSLRMSELPAELHRLTPSQIENFLCICKAELAGKVARGRTCGPMQQRRRAC